MSNPRNTWRRSPLFAASLALLLVSGGLVLQGCEKPAAENVQLDNTAPQGDGSGATGGTAQQLPQGAEGPGGGGAPPR